MIMTKFSLKNGAIAVLLLLFAISTIPLANAIPLAETIEMNNCRAVVYPGHVFDGSTREGYQYKVYGKSRDYLLVVHKNRDELDAFVWAYSTERRGNNWDNELRPTLHLIDQYRLSPVQSTGLFSGSRFGVDRITLSGSEFAGKKIKLRITAYSTGDASALPAFSAPESITVASDCRVAPWLVSGGLLELKAGDCGRLEGRYLVKLFEIRNRWSATGRTAYIGVYSRDGQSKITTIELSKVKSGRIQMLEEANGNTYFYLNSKLNSFKDVAGCVLKAELNLTLTRLPDSVEVNSCRTTYVSGREYDRGTGSCGLLDDLYRVKVVQVTGTGTSRSAVVTVYSRDGSTRLAQGVLDGNSAIRWFFGAALTSGTARHIFAANFLEMTSGSATSGRFAFVVSPVEDAGSPVLSPGPAAAGRDLPSLDAGDLVSGCSSSSSSTVTLADGACVKWKNQYVFKVLSYSTAGAVIQIFDPTGVTKLHESVFINGVNRAMRLKIGEEYAFLQVSYERRRASNQLALTQVTRVVVPTPEPTPSSSSTASTVSVTVLSRIGCPYNRITLAPFEGEYSGMKTCYGPINGMVFALPYGQRTDNLRVVIHSASNGTILTRGRALLGTPFVYNGVKLQFLNYNATRSNKYFIRIALDAATPIVMPVAGSCLRFTEGTNAFNGAIEEGVCVSVVGTSGSYDVVATDLTASYATFTLTNSTGSSYSQTANTRGSRYAYFSNSMTLGSDRINVTVSEFREGSATVSIALVSAPATPTAEPALEVDELMPTPEAEGDEEAVVTATPLPGVAVDYELHLSQGWNLVSAIRFGSYVVSSDCLTGSIWGFEPSQQGYVKQAGISPGNDLPSGGFWVKASAACTVGVGAHGFAIPSNGRNLVNGWNLLPGTDSNWEEAGADCTTVAGPYWYNPLSRSWTRTTYLQAGSSYFVYLSGACTTS
ncbi:hypothetical protein AUJ65_02395 [Candidatus Micrarchaeota archaeon CG1_02_51_15]|nr:MAG: hypothetical protein AUJ65_02395 [Candidatus Micrarchaeota archaeon CG1_02_51_15]